MKKIFYYCIGNECTASNTVLLFTFSFISLYSGIDGDEEAAEAKAAASHDELSDGTLSRKSPEVSVINDHVSPPKSDTVATSASIKVEDDGSVFVNADENYLKERNNILPVIEGKKDTIALGNQLKLSNDLLYSMD